MHRHLHNGNLKLSSVEEGRGGKGRVCEGKREAKGSGERRVHGTTSRGREKGAENAFNRFFKAQGRKPQMPLPAHPPPAHVPVPPATAALRQSTSAAAAGCRTAAPLPAD